MLILRKKKNRLNNMSYLKKFKNRKKASSPSKFPNINAIEEPPVSKGEDIWPKIVMNDENKRTKSPHDTGQTKGKKNT